MGCAMAPEFRQSNSEIAVNLRLIPENNVLQLITLCVVAHNKTLVILGALVHNLTEELEGGKRRPIILVNPFPIIQIRLSQDEHVVHIRP